jgi:hypothetical protein
MVFSISNSFEIEMISFLISRGHITFFLLGQFYFNTFANMTVHKQKFCARAQPPPAFFSF